jgi:hypothetical protein
MAGMDRLEAVAPGRRVVRMALVLIVLATACAEETPGSGDRTGSSARYAHPTDPDDLVLRVEVGGGFVPIEFTQRAVPQFSLMGDGRVILEGPQIEIYPPPALPALVELHISEKAIQQVLAAADEAGVESTDRSFDLDTIADATTTTFTSVVDGRENRVSAYALGYAEDDPSLSAADRDARRKLVGFQQMLFDLRSWLPGGSVSGESPYLFDALRLYATPYEKSPDPELKQRPQRWPLPGPLSSFGQRTEFSDARCGVLSGEDARAIASLLEGANTETPWVSEGSRFSITPRPLLPDEEGCPAASAGI